jgi:uncharacterized protein
MLIAFDEPKRLSNLRKHGLDMADFAEGFDFDGARQFPARPSRTGRVRIGLIGWFNGAVVVAAILSPLGSEALALVSLRIASQQERTLHGF